MTTHRPPDVEPTTGEEEAAPNPTQLPVEPEFGQAMPPAEPEDPGSPQPSI